jgi:hypothetical protein
LEDIVMLRKTVATTLSLLVLSSSPGLGLPALYAQTFTQAVSGRVSPVALVPVTTVGVGAFNGAAPINLSGNIALGGASVLPTPSAIAPAVTAVRTAVPAAASQIAAVGAAAVAQPMRTLATPKAAEAAVAQPAQKAQAEAKVASVGEISRQVSEAVEAVGPVAQAPAETAQGLGSKLMRLLMGTSERSVSDSAAAPASVLGTAGAARAENGLRAAPRVRAGASTLKKSRVAKLQKSEAGLTSEQKTMLHALDHVAALYTEHYAPIEWKQQQYQVDFKKEYEKVRGAIVSNPKITFREFQDLLAGFVYSTRDYHVGIQFYSTEKARLPLFIMQAEGKYYIAYIDRQRLPERLFPYHVGDEVVEFDGKPVSEVLAALTKTPNVASTDARLAEMHLTSRARQTGAAVPKGAATLKIRSADGTLAEVKLPWDYTPEMVPSDVPVRDGGLKAQGGVEGLPQVTLPAQQKPLSAFRQFLRKIIPSMAHPFAEIFKKQAAGAEGNKFVIGARESFVPKLGKVLWEIPKESPIYAYVYENEQGRKIGYIRIPDYMGEEQHAQIFAQIVGQFQKITDGLVIDQVNNPGGSLFYMYSLLSMLTSKPLLTPQHRLIIDESDAYWAAGVIQQAMSQGMKKAFMEEMGAEMGGYKPSKSTMESVLEYARFILSELKAGRRFTKLVSLFGIDEIAPAKVRYTKPIMVLINELDFSCGDFFPAILQDNGAAKLFGVRTAGAGGGVKSQEFPNQVGVAGLSYTWTIAQRRNGQPIENIGVSPDIEYKITAEDIKNGMTGYKKAVNEALSGMLPAATKAEPAETKDEAPSAQPGGEEPEPGTAQ